jgi:hypothetical protein
MRWGVVLFGVLGLLLKPGEVRALDVGFNDAFTQFQKHGFGRQIGAEYARFPIMWSPPDGNAIPAYRAALAHGVTPIVTVHGWGCGTATPRESAEEMADLAAAMPRAVISLWNEPNITKALEGGPCEVVEMTPAKMAEVATAGAAAIKSVNPHQPVIGPAVAPIPGWKRYLRGLYSEVPRGLMQVGLNLYPQGRHRIEKVRRSVRLASRLGLPVAITEFDLSAPWLPGRPTKPKQTERAVRMLADMRRVSMLLFNGVSTTKPEFRAIRAALSR